MEINLYQTFDDVSVTPFVDTSSSAGIYSYFASRIESEESSDQGFLYTRFEHLSNSSSYNCCSSTKFSQKQALFLGINCDRNFIEKR